MKKTFIAIAAAASLGLATMSAPTTAEARCWGFGCALAVGLGVATGVAVGTAIANSAYPAYAPVAGYVGCGQAIMKLNTTARLKDIKLPVLAISGRARERRRPYRFVLTKHFHRCWWDRSPL